MSRWGKDIGGRKNHIKYAFLLRSKPAVKYSKNTERPRYLFAYLTDENKIFFDEFVLQNKKEFKRGSILQFVKKIIQRYIDSRTLIYYNFGSGSFKKTDPMFMLWRLFQRGAQCTMTQMPLGMIAQRVSKVFNLGIANFRQNPRKVSLEVAMPKIYEIFDVILKNHACPWITDDFNQRLELLRRPTRRRMYKIVTIGLLHMCIRYIKNKHDKSK